LIAAVLLVACLTSYSWAGWRLGRCLMEEERQRAETSVLLLAAYIIGVALAVLVTAGLGGLGMAPIRLLSREAFLLATLFIVAGTHQVTSHRCAHGSPADSLQRPDGHLVITVVLAASAVAVDFGLVFASAPANWDAMTYHLFLPARWLQVSTLVHVPTVFGDNAAAFAPQNGALLYTATMLLLQSDAATNVLQLPALGAIAVGVYFLARQLGAGTSPAASLCAVPVFFLGPLRGQVLSADVDAWMISFFVAALALLVHYLRTAKTASIMLAGVATGLAAGTKTLGLSLALLLLAVATVLVFARRNPRHLAVFLLLSLVGGGFWYLKNLLHYGNPVFPFELGLGPLQFPGAYGLDAVRAGEFHIDSPGFLLRKTVESFGLPTAAMCIAGGTGLAIRLRTTGNATSRRVAALLLLVAAVWSLWFVFGIPHNSQTRFLLPAVIVLLPGLGPPLEWISRRHGGFAWATSMAILAALTWNAEPWRRWREHVDVLIASDVAWLPSLVLAALCLGLGILAWGLHARRARPKSTRLAGATAILALALLTWKATDANEDSRLERLNRASFADWGEVVELIADAPQTTIAYSGANVPYILMGRRFRHRVLYVDTRGKIGDGFYEHWLLEGRRRYEHHKPGLYRGDDDPSHWLDNLSQVEPSLLVLFRLHPFERSYLPHTVDGFPPEADWVLEHAECFEIVLDGDFSRAFRIDHSCLGAS